jgi:tetratricopeptide (TPR) repeat protein
MQNNALNTDCDPERYLRMIDKAEKRRRPHNARLLNFFAINRAAAYMSLGDVKTAKGYLDDVDSSCLSYKNETYIVYTINLIFCYYALGEFEKAEALYETDLVKLCPFTKGMKKSVEILIGERYYYMKKYDLSYEHLKKLLNPDLNKRQYLCILFRLAHIDVINGKTDEAVTKFKKVAKLGNKLSIVKASNEMIEKLS